MFNTAQKGVIGQITDQRATYPNYPSARDQRGRGYLNDHLCVIGVDVVFWEFGFFSDAFEVCLFLFSIVCRDIFFLLVCDFACFAKDFSSDVGQKVLHCKSDNLCCYGKIDELSFETECVDGESARSDILGFIDRSW